MSTRGCIIELKKDVCKIGYLHYGAHFASDLSRSIVLTPNIWKESLRWIKNGRNEKNMKAFIIKK